MGARLFQARPPFSPVSGVLPSGEVLAGLEAAWQARLLTEVDGAYRFAHDLVREAVEADLSAARRAALHRRLAGVLEPEPASHRSSYWPTTMRGATPRRKQCSIWRGRATTPTLGMPMPSRQT